MSRSRLSSILVALAVLAAAAPLVAQSRLNVRLGTLAPENSPWVGALRSMGAAWTRATDGRVRLTVYPAVVSETQVIDAMAVDGREAATLMVAGLAAIDPAFNAFGIPFFFESDAEVAHVQERLTPLLRSRLEAKGLHLINWGNGGWVQLFSKTPIRSIAELKAAKLFTSEGSPEMVQWYTANGFTAVPLPAGAIPTQLKLPSGQVNAAPSPPAFALALQFFRDAPYMLDVRVAPLVGATVMTDSAWQRIAPEDRPRLLEAAAAMERQVQAEAPGLDARSIEAMRTAGLNVTTLDPAAEAEFRAAAEALAATQRGQMVPADVFDLVLRERDAFRAANGASGGQ